MGVLYPVQNRITHIHIRAGHIDLSPQCCCAISKLAVFHLRQQRQVFGDITLSIGAIFARLGQGATILTHLLSIQFTNVGLALLDQVRRPII